MNKLEGRCQRKLLELFRRYKLDLLLCVEWRILFYPRYDSTAMNKKTSSHKPLYLLAFFIVLASTSCRTATDIPAEIADDVVAAIVLSNPSWDIQYREIVGVHKEGSELIGRDIEPGVVYDKGGLKITAFDVEHMPIDVSSGELLDLEGTTLGYRIDYRGHSVLFSGDTRSTSATNIIQYGKGVDVLIHEVQVPAPGDTPEARLANVSLSVHSTPDQVAAVFRQTRPRLGVYSHIIPPELSADQLLADTDYDGAMLVAEDLMTLTIGKEIVRGRAGGTGTNIFTEADVVDKID